MLEPQPKFNTLLTIIISVFATTILVGAGVYFVMARNNSSGNQQVLETQVDYLNKKIEVLESQKQANTEDTKNIVNEGKNGEQGNQDKFADWQIYRNEQYGFEIKYPKDLIVNQTDSNIITMGSQATPYIVIERYPSRQNIDFQSFVQEKLVKAFGSLLDVNKIKWAEWAHKEIFDQYVIDVEFENMVGGYTGNVIWTYFARGNWVYRISALQGYNNMDQKTFQNQIIPTFKFINGTANWQTYKNENLGLEFKYPQEFTLKQSDHPHYKTGSFLEVHQSGAEVWSSDVVVSVRLDNAYLGTNFQSAWLTVAYDSDIADLSNCQELHRNRGVEKMTDSQVVNRVTWYKGETSGVAAGTYVKSKVHHTFHNDMCYEVTLHLSIANIGNFDPTSGIKEVDESVVWVKLGSIFSTFKFLD